MGYNMEIVVFKKKTLEEVQKYMKDYTFSDLYSDYLFTRLYPDDYDFPDDERAKPIVDLNRNVFKEFFNPPLNNDIAIIIDEHTYDKMLLWLENKLKTTTLYDLKDDDDYEYDAHIWIMCYKQMKKAKIDFETEFVVFQHDW